MTFRFQHCSLASEEFTCAVYDLKALVKETGQSDDSSFLLAEGILCAEGSAVQADRNSTAHVECTL